MLSYLLSQLIRGCVMWKRRYPVNSLLSTRNVSQVLARTTQPLTSKEIRDRFSKYFIEKHDHKFIRSSPVVPLCDPTVAFVNAGMNQVNSLHIIYFDSPANPS